MKSNESKDLNLNRIQSAFDEFFNKFPLHLWGFLGSAIMLLGCLIAGMLYWTEADQGFSIFLFFISELGGIGLSRGAIFFNWGLILGGSALLLFMIGLAWRIQSRWGILLGLIGAYAGINCILVGYFPWTTDFQKHIFTAMSFFYSGMIIVFLYSIFFLLDKGRIFPQRLAFSGFFVAAIFAAFLFLPLGELGDLEFNSLRIGINWFAFLEWLVLFGVIGWILLISLISYNENRKNNLP
ncbi:MAG: DUF998 domain-containing protein [Promethearchaeota archaeon]